MADQTENLPDVMPPITDETLARAGLPSRMEMSPGLAIFFDDALYQRCKHIAMMMSKGASMTPAHLRDKPEACFAVVSRSIVWKLDPFAVAMSTYQTPGGSIGYEGKLIQAILERSGQIEGQIRFTHNGDWAKLRGKFKLEPGKNGGKYPVPTWTQEDAVGLSVTVAARIKGEMEDRTIEVFLESCWPLNSTLWATDPRRQICYTSVRSFANLATPSLLFGIPFDVDPSGLADMRDITPAKPERNEFDRGTGRDPDLGEWVAKLNLAEKLTDIGTIRAEGLKVLPAALHAQFEEVADMNARRLTDNKPQGDQLPVGEPEGDPREEPPPVVEEPAQPQAEQPAAAAIPVDEKPFQRGQRLLALVTTPSDVRDLMNSILDELRVKKEKDLWRDTAQARFTELGGIGKVSTVPK